VLGAYMGSRAWSAGRAAGGAGWAAATGSPWRRTRTALGRRRPRRPAPRTRSPRAACGTAPNARPPRRPPLPAGPGTTPLPAAKAAARRRLPRARGSVWSRALRLLVDIGGRKEEDNMIGMEEEEAVSSAMMNDS
jgi:hypothetical protein